MALRKLNDTIQGILDIYVWQKKDKIGVFL